MTPDWCVEQGDAVEEWRPVVGWPMYQVSNLGGLRSWHARGRAGLPAGPVALGPALNNKGYRRWVAVDGLRRRSINVSVAVCEAFHGPRPPGMVVRHLNNIRTDDRAGNLRWGTPLENVHDEIEAGTFARGERNGMAKLSAEVIGQIRASTDSNAILSARYGVCMSYIWAVRSGRARRHG